jgi:hypothetical protein
VLTVAFLIAGMARCAGCAATARPAWKALRTGVFLAAPC